MIQFLKKLFSKSEETESLLFSEDKYYKKTIIWLKEYFVEGELYKTNGEVPFRVLKSDAPSIKEHIREYHRDYIRTDSPIMFVHLETNEDDENKYFCALNFLSGTQNIRVVVSFGEEFSESRQLLKKSKEFIQNNFIKV